MKVIINEEGFIPGLGRGPFKTPFDLDSNQVFNLRQLGYLVLEVKESPDRIKLDPSHLPEKESQPEEEGSLIEEVNTEDGDQEVEETEETADKELDTEEETESDEDQEVEETADEEEESQEESEDEEFDELVKEIGKESTVPELKKLLDDAGIEYKYNARKDELLEKIEQNKDKL